MSGRVASPVPVEIGWPPLTSWKRAAAPAPTSRETKILWLEPETSSHTTHGTVGLAGFIVPAATRGSSASLVGSKFSAHACSESRLAPQVLVVSSTPWALLPTATKLKPPSTVPVGGVVTLGATALAANTISLPPSLLGPVVPVPFCSYHTTHGTESLLPVKAMSGSTPSRVVSTFSDGSAPSRSTPTCWKQKPPIAGMSPPG